MTTSAGLTVPASFLRLSDRFGDEVFSPVEAEPVLGKGMKTYLELSRLTRHGWLFRVGRGRYALVDPVVRLSPRLEAGLRPFRSSCFYPILQRTAGGVVRVYGRRLIGIVVFGSAARGAIRSGSDVDLAVFLQTLPPRFEEEDAEAGRAAESAEPLTVEEWTRSKHYHNPSILSVPEAAFDTPGRVMLGVAADGKILYDPRRAITGGLERIRRRLRAAGGRERRTEEGRPYWETGTMFEEARA